MALNQYGLGILFTAKDMATGVVERVGHSVESTNEKAQVMQSQFAKGAKNMATGIGMIGGGLKTLGGLKRTVDQFAGFESVIASAAAIAGASAKGYDKLFKAAQQAGIETMFSPREAALGLRVLSQAGMGVQDSMKALLPSLKLATASFGELGPEQTAGLVVIAMKTFGIEADNVSEAVGRMVHASNTAKMSIGDLQLGLAGASRGSIALNASLSETLISLGMIKNAGFRTQRAATQLSMAMARLADPKAQKKLEKLGIQVVDSAGKFLPFLDVVQSVTTATETMTDAKKAAFLQDVFGTEALGGLMSIMKQLTDGIKTSTGETLTGAAAIEHMRKGIEGAGGAADLMSRKFLATMDGQIRLMKGSLDTLKIAIGGVLAKTFLPIVKTITGALNKMIKAVQALPAPIKDLLAVLAPLAATGLVIAGMGRALSGLSGMMLAAGGAGGMLGGAMGGVGAAADGAGMAIGRYGNMVTVAGAKQIQTVAAWKTGDVMLHEMQQKMGTATKKAGLLARASRGLGGVLSALPLMGVALATGAWIGKLVASHSWIAKEAAMLKKMNAELSLRIKLTKKTQKATATIIRLHKSEHDEILKIAATIKTLKDAKQAIVKVDKILEKQSDKVLAADKKAADLRQAAAASGKIEDLVAAKSAENRFKVELAVFQTMAKTRERVMAKLNAFTVKDTEKGTLLRFKAEASAAFGAWKTWQDRRKAAIEATKAVVAAEREGSAALVKIKQDAADKAIKAMDEANVQRVKLVKQAIAAGVAAEMKPEAARKRVRLELVRREEAVTAPAMVLRERLKERREIRAMGPRAEAPGLRGMIERPMAIIQQTLAQHRADRERQASLEREARRRIFAQPITVNVTVGGKTITKTVDRTRKGEEEAKGGIAVRKPGQK